MTMATKIATRDRKPRGATESTTTTIIVMSAVHWSFGQ